MPDAWSSAAINSPEVAPPKPGLFAEVRRRLRLQHYSLCMEQAYLYGIRRYIRDSGMRLMECLRLWMKDVATTQIHPHVPSPLDR